MCVTELNRTLSPPTTILYYLVILVFSELFCTFSFVFKCTCTSSLRGLRWELVNYAGTPKLRENYFFCACACQFAFCKSFPSSSRSPSGNAVFAAFWLLFLRPSNLGLFRFRFQYVAPKKKTNRALRSFQFGPN